MPATIFSGVSVKTLKDNLSLNDNATILSGDTDDPTSVAKSANPGSLYIRSGSGEIYRKIDSGSSTNWELIGSGNTSGAKNYFPNFDFEGDTTGVSTYDDTGAYVDGTGGSPSVVSISQTTTEADVLEGIGSLQISKSAADGSGEGVTFTTASVDNIDLARGVLYGSFAWDGTDANYTANDLKIHAYDVTNAAELSVEQLSGGDSGLPKLKGTIQYKVLLNSDTDTIRISLHLASDSQTGSAWDVFVDEFEIGPKEPVQGPAVGSWQSFTPTGSWSTNTTYLGTYRRVGDSAEIDVDIALAGAPTATDLTVNLPSGLTIDTTKFNSESAGYALIEDTGTRLYVGSVEFNSTTSVRIVHSESGNQGVVNATNPITFASGDSVYVRINVPISGWSTDAIFANSKVIKMSNYLANGTQITTTAEPARLGEFKVYTKDSSAITGSVDSGAAPVTVADGMRIYGVAFGSAGTTQQPNRWEMFIGKHKHYTVQFYPSAGKAGNASYDVNTISANTVRGSFVNYDPSTGILMVDAIYQAGTDTVRHVAVQTDTDGGTTGGILNAYFEVFVSESPIIVQEEPSSKSIAHTGNGYGSSNTRFRRYTTQLTTGTDITYADSSTLGASWTINTEGIYKIVVTDQSTGSNHALGIGLNSTGGTTVVYTHLASNPDEVLATTSAPDGFTASVSWSGRLYPGDVIVSHGRNIGTQATDSRAKFEIERIK